MQDNRLTDPPALPGNHGQFGEDRATEEYAPLQPVDQAPVKPAASPGSSGGAPEDGSGDEPEAHPS